MPMGRKMITFETKGNWNKTFRFFKRNTKVTLDDLKKYGEWGVQALSEATPVDTGLTADSWGYQIREGNGQIAIEWTNSNVEDGWYNVALMIQYGHATHYGAWVEGIDYINPALKSIYDAIAKHAWREVIE